MPDGKKKIDWSGFKPYEGNVATQEEEAPTSLGGLLGAAVGLLAPQINYVKDVYRAVLEPSKKFDEGMSQVLSGENIPAGALNVLNSFGDLLGASTIQPAVIAMEHGIPKGEVQDFMVDGLNNVFSTPTWVRQQIQKGVEATGITPKDEFKWLSLATQVNPALPDFTEEQIKQISDAAGNTADLAAYSLLPIVKGGIKAGFDKLPKKPVKPNINPNVGESYNLQTGEVLKTPKMLEHPKGQGKFDVSEVGDVKYRPVMDRDIATSELKLKVDDLKAERKDLIGKRDNIKTSLKDLPKEQKKQAIKDLGDISRRINEVDEQLNFAVDYLDKVKAFEEPRNIKGQIEQKSTVPPEPISTENAPSNINFAVATEPGAKTTTKTPTEKVLPVKRSFKESLVDKSFKLFPTKFEGKPVLDSGMLRDILQTAKEQGLENEILRVLRTEAVKRKMTKEFESAYQEAIKEPTPEKVNIKEEKGTTNATEERKLAEGNKPEYTETETRGIPPETSSSDSNVKSGKVQEEVRNYKTLEDLVKEEDSKQITKFVQKELGEEGFNKLNEQVTKELKDIPIEEQGRYVENRWLAEAQKIVEGKQKPSKPSGLSSSTQLNMAGMFDPKLYADVAKYGADLIRKSDTYKSFSKWAEEMKKTYGEEITPQLIKIWETSKTVAKEQKNDQDKVVKDITTKTDKTNLSPKEKITATIQETKFVKELQDFLRDDNIPIEMQNEILKLVKANQDKFSTANLGFFRRKLLDRGTNLTKRYGAAGGELFQRGLNAGAYHKQLLETAYDKYLNKISEIANDKPLASKRDISPEVIKALEDRVNAGKYLTTPEAKEVYKLTSGLYDYFRTELDNAGIKTREDYFTHRILVDEVDRILKDDILNRDPKDIGKGSVNDYYSAESIYTKERRKAEMDLMSDDLMAVLNNYTHSISKHLGFKEVVDYYKNGFLDELNKNPILKTRSDLSYVKEYLKGVLYPEIANSKTAKFITNRRNNLYQALLWNNFKASFQNLGQKFLTQFFISKETKDLANNIYRNQKMVTGKLAEAMAEVKRGGTAHYLEIGSEGLKGSKAEKIDFFRKSEKGNWTYSELAGIIDRASRIAGKPIKSMQELNKILSDKGNFDKAIREARDLSSKTQYNPESTFRPTAYDKWAVRTFAMFTRYPLGTMDLFARTLFKSLDGAQGLRAQTILRRGLTDAENIKPVEFLRATEHYRKSLESVLQQSKKEGYDFKNIPQQKIKQYIDFLKTKEQQMNSVLQKLEPMNKKKNARVWAKYLGYSAVVSFTYRMVQAQLWEALGVTDNKEKTVGQHLTNVIMDVSPLPFYRFNPQEVVNVPLIPNTEFILYNNWNLKGGMRSLLDYGLNTTPYTNILNQSLQRLTGETAGSLLIKKQRRRGLGGLNFNTSSLPSL